MAVGTAVAVGVALGLAVAVGVAVAVPVAVAVTLVLAVGVAVALPGRGVAVTVALSGRGVAVAPARAVPIGVAMLGVGEPVTVAAASFPPASWAASTWLRLPSNSSSPPPALPWSCERSCGKREVELEVPGWFGVATMPSAAFVRQPVVVSRTRGNASRTPNRRSWRDHLRAMAKRYGEASLASIGWTPIPASGSA